MLSARAIRPCDIFSFHSSSLLASVSCLKHLKNACEFSNIISSSSPAFTISAYRPSCLRCSFIPSLQHSSLKVDPV